MIKSLQSLRGIFIFLIFLHHVGLYDAGGDCAVSFFFILSGFVLARRWSDDASRPGLRRRMTSFLGRRLAKLWPLQIIMIAVVLLLGGKPTLAPGFTLKDLLIVGWDALFLQAWVPIPKIYFSCNTAAWFLSDIVFFIYCCSPCCG